jgi:hypothetical protein
MSVPVFKIARSDSDWMKEVNLKVYNLRKIRARIESRKSIRFMSKINLNLNSAKDYILLKSRQIGKSNASMNAMMDWYRLWEKEERKRKIKSIFNI